MRFNVFWIVLMHLYDVWQRMVFGWRTETDPCRRTASMLDYLAAFRPHSCRAFPICSYFENCMSADHFIDCAIFVDLHDAFLEGNSHHFSNFSVEFRGPVREHRPCLRSRRLLPSRRAKGFATRPVVHQSRHLIENFVEVLLHLTWKGSEMTRDLCQVTSLSIDFKWRVKVGMQQSLAFRWTFGEAKPLCPCQLHPQPKAWKLLVFLDHRKARNMTPPSQKNDAVNVALSLTNIRIGTNFWRGRCLEAWVWK